MTPDLQAKYARLQAILREMGAVVIGLSGGVDSTLLVKVAHDTLGERCLAVIGKELQHAVDIFVLECPLALGEHLLDARAGVNLFGRSKRDEDAHADQQQRGDAQPQHEFRARLHGSPP